MNPVARNLRVAAMIAVLIVYFGHQRGVVEASPVVTDWCSNVCDEEVSCTQPCLIAQPEWPAMEITCGEYDGGPTNDWCNGDGCVDECQWWSAGSDVCWWENQETTCGGYGLAGECGDDVCVGWQGETCTNCADDCGPCPEEPECPNDLCEFGETWRTCIDCPEPTGPDDCGDDVCGENEDGSSCPEDCTFSGDWCGGFQECPDGWECLNEVCVWETAPVYWCCNAGNWGGYACPNVHTPENPFCAVGEECRALPGADPGDAPVCQPAWWTRDVVQP